MAAEPGVSTSSNGEVGNLGEIRISKIESASHLGTRSDAVCDGKKVQLGLIDLDSKNAQISEVQLKKANADKLSSLLNSTKVFDRAVSADDVLQLSEKVAKLTDANDGPYAGIYINCLGNGDRAELNAVVMTALVEYISSHTDEPQAQVLQDAQKFVAKVLEGYKATTQGKNAADPEFVVALVGKNGELNAVSNGQTAVAVVNSEGKTKASIASGADGKTVEGKAAMTNGDKIILCSKEALTKLTEDLGRGEVKQIVEQLSDEETEEKKRAAAAAKIEEAKEVVTKPEKKTKQKTEEKPSYHKYPYYEDMPTGESLNGIEQKLKRTLTIEDPNTPGGKKTIEINYLSEVDRLMGEARLLLQKTIATDLLDDLENRVRYPGDWKDAKTQDPLYNLTKIVPNQEVLLMAIEAKRAFLKNEQNKALLSEHEKAQGELLKRREVRTGVRHDTILAEVDGTLEKFFEKTGEVKEIPEDDLVAFNFTADFLMDVTDKSLGMGPDGKKGLTYRGKFQELLKDASTNPQSNRKLLEFRRQFYRNAIDALKSRELSVPAGQATTDQEQVLQEMRVKLQTLQHETSTETSVEALRQKYKGVMAKVSPRTEGKIDAILKKYPAVMLDMALKGGDLMERRARYDGPKLAEIPEVIKHKRLVQGPTSLEEAAAGKGLPPEKKPPIAPVKKPGEDEEEGGPRKKAPKGRGEDEGETQTGVKPSRKGKEPTPAPGKTGREKGKEEEGKDKGKTPRGKIPPAPGKGKTPENATPLQEATIGLVGAKVRIEHEEQDKKVENLEVLEERAREFARLKMTEDRHKWEGKWNVVKQIIPRFWKYTMGEISTYNKEKAFGMKIHAEAGIQMTSLPYEFLSNIDKVAREVVKEKRGKGLGRFWGAVKDLAHEVTFTEKDLHSTSIEIIKELRKKALDPSYDSQLLQNVIKIPQGADAINGYKSVLTGDFNAAEGLARRVSDQMVDQVIHAAVGERVAKGIVLEGPVRNFFVDKIMAPLLKEGWTAGNISEQSLMEARLKIQNYFFDKEFVNWYDKLPKDQQDALKLSMSYGTDIIPFIQETMLPQALQAKAHIESMGGIDDYLKNFVLKVNVGTLESGQKNIIQEGILEKATSRTIKNDNVFQLYDTIRKGKSINLVPDGYVQAATQRADFVASLARIGTHQVVTGVGAGLGIYAFRAGATGFGRILVPYMGGSAIAGVFRGIQERRLFTREYEQHEVEAELGYKFPLEKAAKRRAEMTNIERHKREMQTELTTPMQELMDKVGKKEASQEDLMKLLGLIADTEARMGIEDVRGIGLFKALNPQSYQVEKTNLELTKARAKLTLRNYFGANAGAMNQMASALNITPSGTGDVLDQVVQTLSSNLAENLQKGVGINTEYQAAIGNLKVEEKQSIDAREKAFKHLRNKRTIIAGLTTFGVGTGAGLLSEAASAVLHGGPVTSPDMVFHGPTEIQNTPFQNLGGNIQAKLPPGMHFQQGVGILDKSNNVLVDMHNSHFVLQNVPGGTPKLVEVDNVDPTKVISADPIAKYHGLGINISQGQKVPEVRLNVPDAEKQFYTEGTVVDTDWIKNITNTTKEYAGYKFKYIPTPGGKDGVLNILDSSGKEVAHNAIHYNPTTHEISYQALPVNPIPQKLIKALHSAGLIKTADVQQLYSGHTFLDANDHIGRVPDKVLNQLYAENRVFDTAREQIAPITEGGVDNATGRLLGEVPMGKGTVFDSSEAIWTGYKDWSPMPMTDIVDGKPVFSLAHFINAWEEARVIDPQHVQVISGPNMGKVFNVNSIQGFEDTGNRDNLIRDMINSKRTILFDSNPHNLSVMTAPKEFFDDFRAIKSGGGDLSNFYLEERFDPLSTKGVIMQFNGNNQWNAYADPKTVPGIFKDYAFQDDKGTLRGWTYFFWKPKGGGFDKVFTFANSGPTEHFKYVIGNPEAKLYERDIPTFIFEQAPKEGPKATVLLPFIIYRRPLEAPEGVTGPTPPPVPPTTPPTIPPTTPPTTPPTNPPGRPPTKRPPVRPPGKKAPSGKEDDEEEDFEEPETEETEGGVKVGGPPRTNEPEEEDEDETPFKVEKEGDDEEGKQKVEKTEPAEETNEQKEEAQLTEQTQQREEELEANNATADADTLPDDQATNANADIEKAKDQPEQIQDIDEFIDNLQVADEKIAKMKDGMTNFGKKNLEDVQALKGKLTETEMLDIFKNTLKHTSALTDDEIDKLAKEPAGNMEEIRVLAEPVALDLANKDSELADKILLVTSKLLPIDPQLFDTFKKADGLKRKQILSTLITAYNIDGLSR